MYLFIVVVRVFFCLLCRPSNLSVPLVYLLYIYIYIFDLCICVRVPLRGYCVLINTKIKYYISAHHYLSPIRIIYECVCVSAYINAAYT